MRNIGATLALVAIGLAVEGASHLKGGRVIGRARTSDNGWQRVAIDLFDVGVSDAR